MADVDKNNPQLYLFGKPVSKEEAEEHSKVWKATQAMLASLPKKKPVGETRKALSKILEIITGNECPPDRLKQVSNQWSGSDYKKNGDLRMGHYDPCSWYYLPNTHDKGHIIFCSNRMKDFVKHWESSGWICFHDESLYIITSEEATRISSTPSKNTQYYRLVGRTVECFGWNPRFEEIKYEKEL